MNKFAQELKDDCLVVIEAWPLPDLKPDKVIKENNLVAVYFYKGLQFKSDKVPRKK